MYKAVVQHPLLGWLFYQKSEILYLSGYNLRQHRTGTDVVLTEKNRRIGFKGPSHHCPTWI